jgi:hypothetical protein
MSLAISDPRETKFLARFEHVCAALRQFQIRKGLCWTLLAAALGLAVLAAADFRLELPWNMRAAGLFAWAAATLAVVGGQVIAPLRWWTEPRTAVEIESRFPQLGQRIRTVVQYSGLSEELIHTEGAAPSLVDALEQETEIQVQPLPLDRIVPWQRVWAVAALAAVPMLFLLIATARDVEWRIALERALLSRRPYTTLTVAPGNLTVEQGDSVPITVDLHGRLKRDVVLYTRPAEQPDATWKARPLDAPDRGPARERAAKLEKVEKPLDYRVVAGPASSPTYRLEVRYPLALTALDVALKPPTYTGVKPSTVKGGNVRAIEGTDATFQIAFDAPPAEASLVLTDPSVQSRKDKSAPVPIVVPLKLSGTNYTAELKLKKGFDYQIQARTADGRVTPKNRYKIEVLEDRAPRVAFEQPDEALEVHPVAEVLNRIRVGDDFGLTKAGIVFQFNNGDEQTLIVDNFKAEPAKTRTSAALQETLLLEKLAASPTDSLTYYAFAEDNYPAGARRTETDLRYLDIRPFKREYKQAESGTGEEGEGELASLAELIARQRFNLNRAKRLANHKPTDKTFAEDPLKIAGFEETLVGLTRELTEGIEGIVGQRIEPFHAAEESMLAAIAALDHGQNERAPAHMGDALRHLIEARDSVRILIGDDAEARKAMRAYDRTQAQKIRKPKKDKEEAEEIAEEIEQVAQEEDFVYATLNGLMMEQKEGEAKKGEESKADEAKDAEKKMEPDEKKDEAKKDEAKKGQAKKGEKSPKGPNASKGSGKGQGKGTDGENGEPDDEDKAGEPEKNKRRDAAERQEKAADKIRELEEKLKKLESASDLAKARMANAAETAEKTSGALARGNTPEATESAKAAAAKLHELARQIKGELAREVATELAMARDLADELAEREAELGQTPGESSESGSEPGDKDGKNAASKPGKGKGARGGSGDLTEAEQLERLEEAAKTLEHWLKDASLSAEGQSAERIRELLEDNTATRVVDRMQRIGELYLGGQKPEARRDATELARSLELLARQLDVLYRGIIAPELAKLVDLDKRVAELMEKLKTVKAGEETVEWRRLAEALVRDLEKAGLATIAKTLTDLLAGGDIAHGDGPDGYLATLGSIATFLQRKIQDMILKDMVSARDEATPPAFKELVDRYYEVLSKNGGSQ